MMVAPPFPSMVGTGETKDYYSQRDVRGELHREEVSSYVVPNMNTIPREFNPNTSHTQFVLHLYAEKAKNRRRYNKDILRRYKRKIVQDLILDEIIETT